MESCLKHPHEMGVAICRRCGGAWCKDCLVYSFGPKKPPYCMSCAMVAGGVRTGSIRPPMAKRQVRALAKAARSEAKQAAAAQRARDTEPESTGDDALEPVMLSDTDWGTPWWEDRQPTMAD